MMELIHGASEAESQLEAAIAFLFQFVGGGLEAIESTLEEVPGLALAALAFVALLVAGVATVASGGLPAVELSDVVMCFHTFSGP